MDRIDGDECCDHCVMDVEGACPHVADGVHAYPCDVAGCVAFGASDIPATAPVDIDDPATWPDCSMTLDEARSTPSESGHGWMLDGMNPYWPAQQCHQCGRFVGRDGYQHTAHREMSNQIDYIEAECLKCMTKENTNA